VKNNILATAFAALTFTGIMNTASAANSVTFTGTVLPTLCSLNINGLGLTADVVFPDILLKDVSVGPIGTPVQLNVIVSNCPEAALATTTLTFSGTKSASADAFVVDTTDVTSGVVIELKDNEGNQIVPNTPKHITIVANDQNVLAYTASMRALNDNVKTGHFDTIATLDVAYD
jgi:type 1 fimbria pilin